MYAIEQVYRVWISVKGSPPWEREERFINQVERLLDAKKYDSVESSDSSAGPAWNSYFVLICAKRRTLEQLVSSIESVAKRTGIELE